MGFRSLRPLSGQDDAARIQVALACTPFRDLRPWAPEGGDPLYSKSRLPHEGELDLKAVNVGGTGWDARYDFADADTALASLWLASRQGPIRPENEAQDPLLGPDPVALNDEIRRLSSHNSDGISWYEGTGWRPSLRGLTPLLAWRARDTAWLVLGDTCFDFALGQALSRMSHHVDWLPTSWIDPTSPYVGAARAILMQARFRADRGDPVRVVSISGEVEPHLARLLGPELSATVGDEAWLRPAGLDEIKATEGGILLALQNDFDRDLAAPVFANASGDLTLVNPLPPLIPETIEVFEEPAVDWVIELAFSDHSTPRGRGLPPDALQSGADAWRERVRSGRDGHCVMASSFGFVPAGATPRQRTARPRLVAPSLSSWVREMAGASALQVHTSDAGHVAEVATRLWGSREALAEDLWRHGELFREFLSESEQTKTRYPNLDGVVLRRDGYLSWPAIRRMMPDDSDDEEVRAGVDRLVALGGLRRGLILRCPDCAQVQFSTPHDPQFGAPCSRCGARVPVSQETWKLPVAEPTWYYDLHPVVRRMLGDHGDVPLLAERHIRQQVRRLVGLAETDIVSEGRVKGEVDIICGAEELVVVGEAKAEPTMKPADATKKARLLPLVASALRADLILLASGRQGDWDDAVVRKLQDAVSSQRWVTGFPPAIRVISGLRSDQVKDVTLT